MLLLHAALCLLGGQSADSPEWREVFRGGAGSKYVTAAVEAGGSVLFVDSNDWLMQDGASLWRLPVGASAARRVMGLDEQGAAEIYRFGRVLLVPGPDATESWEYGNFYYSNDLGANWRKMRSIPGAIHVFDMLIDKDGLFACGAADQFGACVWKSRDGGATWARLGSFPAGNVPRVYEIWDAAGRLTARFADFNGAQSYFQWDGKAWVSDPPPPQMPAFWPSFGRHRTVGAATVFMGGPGPILWSPDGGYRKVAALDGHFTFDMILLKDDTVLALGDDRPGFSAVYGTTYKGLMTGDRPFERLLELPEKWHAMCFAAAGDALFVGGEVGGVGRAWTTAVPHLR